MDRFEPSQFGRYQLVELLAVGGMAEIFKAKSRGAHGFEKTLVIKRILPHLARDREFIDMFIDEAKLMVRLNHPKIVQVLDFGEIEGQYYMALEYVDGIDGLALLRQCAKRRCRPTTGIVLHIVAGILDALDYAHNLRGPDGRPLQIVHRDISPSNLFVSLLGEVKLGDFGIARAAIRRDRSEGGVLKGKYGYMAPEQATGAQVDHRADIFAVGVVLSELLMIRRLFFAKNDLEILLQVRDARLDRLNKFGHRIPPDLRVILDAALAREPEMRYQSAGAFRDALHRYLFENRRMVRAHDVRNFLVRLTKEDSPVTQREGPETGEVPLEPPPACPSAHPRPSERELENQATTPRRIGDPGESWPRQISVGKKRKIIVTPPPIALPVPTGLPQTGEEPRIDTAHALAAVPEMAIASTSSKFDCAPLRFEDDSQDLVLPPPAIASPEMPEYIGNIGQLATNRSPSRQGNLSGPALFRLFFQLAVAEQTGLLIVAREDVRKEIYLVNGDPHYVSSNRPNELFGQYLVERKAITEGELSMALAMLPHFKGRLGDALVGLKLMRPVQVLRHLTSQVRQKLLDVFLWEEGAYRFYDDETCTRESAPLGLDAFEIMGAAVGNITRERLDDRVRELLPARLKAVSPAVVPPEVFRLGGRPRRAYDKLNGKHKLVELVSMFDDEEQREAFLRIVVLLVDTGLAVAEKPGQDPEQDQGI